MGRLGGQHHAMPFRENFSSLSVMNHLRRKHFDSAMPVLRVVPGEKPPTKSQRIRSQDSHGKSVLPVESKQGNQQRRRGPYRPQQGRPFAHGRFLFQLGQQFVSASNARAGGGPRALYGIDL